MASYIRGSFYRKFINYQLADEFAEKLRPHLDAIRDKFELDVWLEVEKIYETRWDCSIVLA